MANIFLFSWSLTEKFKSWSWQKYKRNNLSNKYMSSILWLDFILKFVTLYWMRKSTLVFCRCNSWWRLSSSVHLYTNCHCQWKCDTHASLPVFHIIISMENTYKGGFRVASSEAFKFSRSNYQRAQTYEAPQRDTRLTTWGFSHS